MARLSGMVGMGWLKRLRAWLDEAGLRPVKRIIVGIIGFTVLLIGIAMIVLPGPAFIVVPLGLLILSSEFAWARVWLNRARKLLKKGKGSDSAESTKH